MVKEQEKNIRKRRGGKRQERAGGPEKSMLRRSMERVASR